MDGIAEAAKAALGLGLDGDALGWREMIARAIVVYLVTVGFVRLAKKRFMGQASAFDVILGIMLGSIVSRAVTGNAPFGPALGAAATLLALHWLLSGLALRLPGFGGVIKGKPRLLVQDGRADAQSLRAAHMTENDLWEDLRGQGVSRLAEVREAHLERNGRLSVLRAKNDPKVLEVRVAEGVQTVRIELSG
jgi:uncharacterized membrane protein YcaP (DUF421 family)